MHSVVHALADGAGQVTYGVGNGGVRGGTGNGYIWGLGHRSRLPGVLVPDPGCQGS